MSYDEVNWDEDTDITADRLNQMDEGIKDLDNKGFDGTVTVTVGGSGDYSSINDAIDYVTKEYPPASRATVEIQLLSGFVMEEQVLVEGVNLGWIEITAEDSEVDIDVASLTDTFFGDEPAFGVSKGVLPVINVLFGMGATTADHGKHGVYVRDHSCALVKENAGIKNAYRGIHAETGSTVVADDTDFSGAVQNGIFAYKSSKVIADGASISSTGTIGVYVTRDSSASIQDADVSEASNIGVQAEAGSKINARDCDARVNGDSESNNDIEVRDGSIISANGADGGTSQNTNEITSDGIIFK